MPSSIVYIYLNSQRGFRGELRFNASRHSFLPTIITEEGKRRISRLIKLYEIPAVCWPRWIDFGPYVDRSNVKINEYLNARGFELTQDPLQADVLIRKAELSLSENDSFLREELLSSQFLKEPGIFLIGEPRELAPAAYRYAKTERSLAVAPGNNLKRMFFGRPWEDPQTENWSKRLDRFCWIGRPLPHRIEIAQKIVRAGYALDIYSQEAWPLSCWRGPAKSDVETARNYKYRIVCENSNQFLYHSEKLFTGVKSGCVCFYWADPHLNLKFIDQISLALNSENLKNAQDMASKILEGMNSFMFSDQWEIYSIRQFIDDCLDLIEKQNLALPQRENRREQHP